MVVFTCNHCGDSIRKPGVEKHYNVCRKSKNLTCVDCHKDFMGDAYNVHNKCVSENERYAAKGSIPLGIKCKGEAKQEAWIDMIKSILDSNVNLSGSAKNLFADIISCSNVPRKKQKFFNFVSNMCGHKTSIKFIAEVWESIEKYTQENSKTKQNEEPTTNGNVNSVPNSEGEKLSKKKRKNSESSEKADKTSKKKIKKGEGIGDVSKKDSSATEEKKKLNEDIENSEVKNQKNKKQKKNKKETETLMTTEGKNLNKNAADNLKLNENKISPKQEVENGPQKEKSKKNKHKQTDENFMQNIFSNNEKGIKKKKLSNETQTEKLTDHENNTKSQIDHNKISDNEESFNVEKAILKILKKKSEISLEKLQNKVTAKYLKHVDKTEVPKKFIKKFNKKISNIENVDVVNDIVKIKNV